MNNNFNQYETIREKITNALIMNELAGLFYCAEEDEGGFFGRQHFYTNLEYSF